MNILMTILTLNLGSFVTILAFIRAGHFYKIIFVKWSKKGFELSALL